MFQLLPLSLKLSQPDIDPDKVGWIAAKFEADIKPKHIFHLGDGTTSTGGYENRPLKKGQHYRVFLRAYAAGNVS